MAEMRWQDELETAERLISVGDVSHALTHLGAALALSPNEERIHASVEAIAAKHPLLELLAEDGFVGTRLLKGFALRRVGRVDEAIVLVAQLAELFPARRFEALLAAWVATARAAGRQLASEARDQLTRLLSMVGQSTIGLHRLLPGERELLSGYEALADVALEASPVDESLRFVAAGIYRRLGLLEKSFATVEGVSGYFGCVQRGLAQRASGDFAAALKSFQKASEFPESGRSDVLEQVRCHLALRDFGEAGKLLETVPGERGTQLSGMRLLAANGTDGDVIDLLDGFLRMERGPISAPSDATVGLLREHREKFHVGSSEVEVALDGWEAPSNRLLIALFASGTSDVSVARYSLAGIPAFERDPRKQVRGAPPSTWHEVGGVMVQVSAAPADDLRAQLATAGAPDSKESMWSRAAALAKSLTVTPAELMAAMVHPPVDEPWLETLPDGLYRYQLGIAFVLAQLPMPWRELKPHFESLLFGPVDWTSAVAVTALAEKARRDPAAAREAVTMLTEVVNDLLPHACEPRALALVPEFRELPGITAEARDALSAWFETHIEGDDAPVEPPRAADPAAAAPTPPAPESLIPSWVWLVVGAAVVAAILALNR